jgi:ferredoxin
MPENITICVCSSRTFIDKDKVSSIAALLRGKGHEITIKPDLCKMIMLKNPDLNDISSSTILACYPRAIRSLLDTMQLKAGKVIDIRNGEIKEILNLMQVESSPDAVDDNEKGKVMLEIEQFPAESGTDAWYPALDKEKCMECGKCHDFCLFGVYTIENKKIKVVNPQNCKNNCPACARVCPSKAIIFPKYGKSPINGGTEMEEAFNPEEMDLMYKERLKYRLQQRRFSVPFIKAKE